LCLEWGLEIASSGDALPPLGFVADVGLVAFNLDRGKRRRQDAAPIPGLSSVLGRTYEDHVLGKLYGDWTFEHACDALRRYEKGRDWARGLAFLFRQFRRRVPSLGVLLSPSLIRGLMEQPADETLKLGFDSITKTGPMPLIEACYQSLVEAARRMPEILDEADLAALRNGIALAPEGQRLAHELVIHTSTELLQSLPEQKVAPLPGRREIATKVLDEDTYPVGGFAAITTRGSIESLMHSQLAFMEPGVRPDLFDLKYLRDELYYYSRDENQFLRRRRSFVIVLYPDLVRARFKDPESNSQRIIMLMGFLLAAFRRLCQWLSSDALRFDFLFLHERGATPLTHEIQLFQFLFRDQIENRTVGVSAAASIDAVISHCAALGSRSECHVLTAAMRDEPIEADGVVVSRLSLANPTPAIADDVESEPVEQPTWNDAMERLLRLWV
jgi:hypothetical protein